MMKNLKSIKTIKFILVFLILSVSSTSLFAFGNKEVPEVPLITSGTQYLSPDSNGVKDTATLSFSVKMYAKSEDGYVPEYGLEILDSADNIMKKIVETEKSDISWFSSIFRGYTEFSLNRDISWDGTDQNGNVVEDGIYNVKLWVKDSSNNKKEIDVDDFIVDTMKPELLIVNPDILIFSPNGDNSMDNFEISHTQSTEEALWEATIRDKTGVIVRSFSWENGTPDKAVWDGLDNSGKSALAGSYTYTISSVDEAGNESGSISLEGISLDLTITSIAISIDNTAISPDGNGVKDSITASLDISETEGIKSWEWQIRDENATVYWQVTGDGEVPEEIFFDGTDSEGSPVPEGNYNFIYKLYYKNGNNPTAIEPFVIDLTSPKILVSVINSEFSPNGDGFEDQAEIHFNSNEKVSWKGSILDNQGEDIVSTSSNNTTSLIVWDGMDTNGVAVPDGDYSVLGTFIDIAGNITLIEPSILTVKNFPIKITLKTVKGFSPDSNGSSDNLVILVDSTQYDNLDSWQLDVLDINDNIIKNIQGYDVLPTEILWDGGIDTDDGEFLVAEEGSYSVKLSADYQGGISVEAISEVFTLDITPPEISVDIVSNPFTATDKGVDGEVYVTLKVIDNTDIDNWSMDILNTDGEIIRTYSGKGDPSGDIIWNSNESNNSGRILPGKPDFILKLSVFDIGNNESILEKAIPLDVLLVLKNGKKYLSVPNIIFAAYKFSLGSAGAKKLANNNSSLDRVANIFSKYPTYGLVLEGHALNIYLDGAKEDSEEKILLPLTARRADTVKTALIKRGIPSTKISTEAFGGQLPIVPVTDRSIRWKNRRVEFVMTDPVK